MTGNVSRQYWSSLARQIRDVQGWSQARLAEELATNQETISRWENASVVPSAKKQAAMEQLAEKLLLSSLRGIASIVRCSPYPMLLCSQDDAVVAASASSGFREGVKVLSQTPAEQHAYYRDLAAKIENAGFWKRSGERSDYAFTNDRGQSFRAVLISIDIRGQIYCLVQAMPGVA
jgi:transcriptional regulator with XRE-family HTH domain